MFAPVVIIKELKVYILNYLTLTVVAEEIAVLPGPLSFLLNFVGSVVPETFEFCMI